MSASAVSTFENASDITPRHLDVSVLLRLIRTGGKKLRGQIEQIRNRFQAELAITGDYNKAKRTVDLLKKQLPGVTWSGTFSQRASDKLVQHSGLLVADLDSLGEKLADIRKKLLNSPHLWALFVSPSGDGLKAVHRVSADAQKHPASWRAVQKHVLELAGVQIDQSGKDPARLCFLSYDPELYHNPNAVEIEPLPEPESPKLRRDSAQSDGKPDQTQIRAMLAVIPKRPDYPDWIKVVAAVGDALSEEDAVEVLCEWSDEERPGEYAEKLRHRLKDVHVGTLIYLAREHGWKPKTDTDGQGRDFRKEPEVEPNKSPAGDEETIARLAALPALQYERVRKAEADKLGCRESVLDHLVNAKRLLSNPASDALQGAAVTLADVEAWPEPVTGADVLEAVAERIGHYVVMSPGAADVIALWCAHTHCYKSFMHTPRLTASSAEKQSGKTTLRDACAEFVARPILTENTTCAVLFRLVSGQFPTLLADEYDSWIKENEELRGLLNAGHRRGAIVHRCEGDGNEVRGFAVFAPVMLCGIGALPGTLHDRSIVIRLARAKRGEIQARFDSRHVEVEDELCRKLARWIADHRASIEACEPVLPETAFNRLADNWRPLFAIAEIAGGQWPKRCADAFAKLTSSDDLDAQGIGTMLLFDIDEIFKKKSIDQIPSAELAESLAEIEGRPWAEWGTHRKPISPNQLANQLRHFEVKPDSIKFGDKTLRGYRRTDFKEAFDRYVSQTPVPECNSATTLGKTPDFGVQPDNQRLHPENGLSTRESCGVALCTEGRAENEADKQAEPLIDGLGVARL
jgi:hypothetical protein